MPLPSKLNIRFGPESLGWLQGTTAQTITFMAILIGMGHSLLAMSGEESLAQVNREIAAPKLLNLEKAGLVIFLYSLLFTSLVSFFAVMLIPDGERGKYLDNLIGGLSMYLMGPLSLRLLFHGFVLVVGVLILGGAVNTAIIGSNGVLNRVAEDGVMADWFRVPHKKFGTTSRIINMVVILQLLTIVISRGDVYMLGEAYAFGVVWSFAMKALAVMMLRFKMPGAREWKVPGNIQIGSTEYPVGLAIITLALFTLAIINVLTKKVATISGVAFTIVFFTMFMVSERINRRKKSTRDNEHEHFRLAESDDVSDKELQVRPGNVIVSVRNPDSLDHLRKVLEKTDIRKVDIVALSIHRVTGAGSGEHAIEAEQMFSSAETVLFSRVVALAEKAGKPVELLVVAGIDPWEAMVQTAQKLQSSRIVTGYSTKMTPNEVGLVVGQAWEKLPAPRPSISLEVVLPDEKSMYFNLGPHPPRLWPEDVDLLHRLWLELSDETSGAKVHHRDVVGVALQRLEAQLRSEQRSGVLEDMRREALAHPEPAVVIPPKNNGTMRRNA